MAISNSAITEPLTGQEIPLARLSKEKLPLSEHEHITLMMAIVTVLTRFHIMCILLFVFITLYHVSYRPVCFLHVTTHESLCTSLCFYLFLHHVTTPSKLLLLTSPLLFFFSSFLHASSCESNPPVPSHVT